MEIQVNIIPYVCYAFGLNKKSYNLIDKVYDENKETYFSYASQSEFYNKAPIVNGTPMQIEYARKILGILLYMLDKQNVEIYRKVIEIYKKSFNYLYQLIQSYKEIELLKIMKKFKEEIFSTFSWTRILNSDIYIIMTLFGASLLNKPIKQDEHYQFFINTLYARQEHDLHAKNKLTLSQLKTFAKEGKELKIKLESFKPDLINCEFVGKNQELIESLFAFMCDVESVSILEILEETMDKKTLDEIFSFVYILRKMYNQSCETEQDLEEAYENFVAMFYFRALLKEFNKFREFYLKNADVIHERNKLLFENNQLKQEIQKLRENIENLYNQREILLNNISKLKNELKAYEQDLQELYKLREILFEKEVKTQEPKEELDLSVLKDKRLVIIGGINDWINSLKKFFHESTVYLEADRLNYDENSVFNAVDLVVFNTKYLSHSAYYKAINQIKKLNIPYLFINHNNIKLSLSQIVDFLKKKEESE